MVISQNISRFNGLFKKISLHELWVRPKVASRKGPPERTDVIFSKKHNRRSVRAGAKPACSALAFVHGRQACLPTLGLAHGRQARQGFFIYSLPMLMQLKPLSAYDSGYSFQHAQTRHQPVLGLVGACADRVQPWLGMRGPAGPGGVRHYSSQPSHLEKQSANQLVTSSLSHHLGAAKYTTRQTGMWHWILLFLSD